MGQGGEVLGSEAGIDSRTFHNNEDTPTAQLKDSDSGSP
jgi:hypothetical protein